MRALLSTTPRRLSRPASAVGALTAGLLAVALAGPNAASAGGVHSVRIVPPPGGVHSLLIPPSGPQIIPNSWSLATRLVDADANYAGVGFDGHGTLSLQTNAASEVSYYSTSWNKTVCGVKHFGLGYDAAGDPGIAVDAAGIFVESYQIRFRTGGRGYVVQAIDAAQIGMFTDQDGVSRDMLVFRERVRVRRDKAGAKWCKGVHKKAFVGYRITHGA